MNSPELYLVATDGNGKPVAGALLQATAAGSTSLPKALFADEGLTIALPNPLVADASGVFQQFHLGPGGYRFALLNPDGSQLRPPRDYIFGTGDGSGGTSDHKVLATSADESPGYLDAKIEGTNDIVLAVNATTQKVCATLSASAKAAREKVSVDGTDPAGYLADKVKPGAGVTVTKIAGAAPHLEISVDAASILDHKVATDSNDPSPGHLTSKLDAVDGIVLEQMHPGEVGDYLRIRGLGTVKMTPDDQHFSSVSEAIMDTETVIWRRLGVDGKTRLYPDVNLPDSGLVKCAADDIEGYLGAKIRAGTGTSITMTDDASGKTLWINAKTNLWTPIKYIQTLAYTVVDTDATLIVGNGPDYDTGLPVVEITLPTPSAKYLGRIIVIRGSRPQAGWHITNSNLEQVGTTPQTTGTPDTVFAGYARTAWTCFLVGATGTYKWVLDTEFA